MFSISAERYLFHGNWIRHPGCYASYSARANVWRYAMISEIA